MYVMFEYFNRNKDQHCNVNTRNTGSDNAEKAAMCVALGYDNISATDNLSEKLEYIMKKQKDLILKLASKLDVEKKKKKTPPPLPTSTPSLDLEKKKNKTPPPLPSSTPSESDDGKRRKAIRFEMTPVKNSSSNSNQSAPSTDPILKRSMMTTNTDSSLRVKMEKAMKPIRGRLYKQTKHVKAWELREVWLEGTSLKYCSTMLGDMNGHKNNVKMKHASLSQRISLSREHVRFVDLRGAVVRNIDAAEMRQLKGRGYGFEISAIPPQSSSSHRTTWKWTRLLFSSDTLEDRMCCSVTYITHGSEYKRILT